MKRSLALCTAIAVLSLAGAAHADNKDKADALFKRGKKLMHDKRYADACEAFESSQKLDPGIGTQLNIAKCYEEWGKLARALVAYQAAEKAATDANDPRVPKIHELVVALDPDVPRLTLKLGGDAPAGLKVTLDGRPVDTFNEAFVVDPGPHTIEWAVGGGDKRRKIVPLDRGGASEVTLDMPAHVASGEPAPSDTTAAEPSRGAPRGRVQRITGLALGGAGLVAIGVSSYLTLSARGDYNDALDMYCGGMKDNCDATGLSLTHDARSTANKATIVVIAGAALVAGGAALYLLAPNGEAPAAERQTVYLAPALSPTSVGVVLGGAL